ncbi:class F sortase [Paenibacillus sp. J22TS3]|uniref:class F sortase n=1 Tax=Paenibacillus sp. J22TS3 TaxID=2807192 RepID=UPI001B291C8B|nr:class F sortase [Paenibacillus sp. J22TS3]GIP23545.1 hypothetical protein J22TS3_38200 [Paenibacillus sp. J22TS3]
MNKIRITRFLTGIFYVWCCAGCSTTPNSQSQSEPRPIKVQTETKLPIPKPDNTRDFNFESFKGIVPYEISIPSVKLQARIEPVSFLKNGQMGVPHNTDRVGFLKGVLPGNVGNAVMDGHVDTYTGPAVFFPLKRLKQGDFVYIKNNRGCKIRFIVKSVNYYATSEAPTEAIFGPSLKRQLNLITCAGRYSRSRREHEGRLVVYTELSGVEAACNQQTGDTKGTLKPNPINTQGE